MAESGFAADDEVGQSLRIIEKQRATKRFAVFGGMIAALVILVLAVVLGYSDKPDVGGAPGQSVGAP